MTVLMTATDLRRSNALSVHRTHAVAEDPTGRQVTGGDNGLSPRELEVVGLVADGLSNPEIAEKLYISKRTVESHLDHVKYKLGFESRHQIMAWALRARFTDDRPPADLPRGRFTRECGEASVPAAE